MSTCTPIFHLPSGAGGWRVGSLDPLRVQTSQRQEPSLPPSLSKVMELHSPAAVKKLWRFLRVAFFMMRKGLISKRKMVMDMNLMMKRGKLLGKSLGNLLMFHHHHQTRSLRGEYEFSCSNSPNPVFFHAKRRARHHNYFPCINAILEEPDETPRPVVIVLPRIEIEYSPQPSFQSQDPLPPGDGEKPSPLSIRISNYSSEVEEDGSGQELDNEAEEFIKRFYEQLRAQSRMAFI